jgi:hypothetical protein
MAAFDNGRPSTDSTESNIAAISQDSRRNMVYQVHGTTFLIDRKSSANTSHIRSQSGEISRRLD